jgi:hypothetical protein
LKAVAIYCNQGLWQPQNRPQSFFLHQARILVFNSPFASSCCNPIDEVLGQSGMGMV